MPLTNFSPEELDFYKHIHEFLLNDKDKIKRLLESKAEINEFLELLDSYDRSRIDESQFPEEIRQQLQVIKTEISQFEQKIRADEAFLEEAEKSEVTRELSSLQKRLDRLIEQKNELQKKLEEESSEVSKLQQQLETAKKSREETEAKVQKEKEISEKDDQDGGSSTITSSGTDLEDATTDDGRYEIIRFFELQSVKPYNKFAEVEVFTAKRAGEKVIVKKFQRKRDFEEEVRVTAQLHSGYVALVYGACGKATDRIIVHEYLRKGNLYSLIMDQKVDIPWEKRWSIACDICLAMWYLHGRYPAVMCKSYTLKPYNILVGNDFRAKLYVGGLGIPSDAPNNISQDNFDKQWLAPELLLGNDSAYGERTDAYAYGVILWMLAERKSLYQIWPDPDELQKKILAEERPPTSPSVPEEFAKLIEWSWRPKPESRYTFRRMEKPFKDKGLLFTKLDAGKEAVTKIEDINREFEIQKQLLERLERQFDQADRKYNRERQLTECCIQELEAAKNRLELEKKRYTDLERRIEDFNQKSELSRLEAAESEKQNKKELKNQEQKQKRFQENLEEELEEQRKKYENERRRGDALKKQLEEIELMLTQERDRRIDAEKRRDEYRARCP